MKKIAALTIVFMLLVSTCMPAFADLDEGDFDNWYVVCGPAGFSFVDAPEPDQEGQDMHDYLEPGVKLWVHSFDSETKKYLLVISSESNHKIKGHGFVNVTEDQLNKYFVGDKQVYSTKYTKKLDEKVECVVTPSVGIVLRQGPDVNYPSFRTIPQNTKLTYQYVFEGETYNWAYVTYKGQDGWCCINYTEKIVPTTEATTETTTEATTETTTEATTEPTTETTTETTEPATEVLASTLPVESEAATEVTAADQATDFFSSTRNVVIVCCLGAVILALTAVVILLIVKRKKG